MRNTFPGACYRCGGHVDPGAGQMFARAGGWDVQCVDCAIRWRRTKPVPSKCFRCGDRIAVGDGHFEKWHGYGWRAAHADCAIRYNGQPAPTPEEARAARRAAPNAG